MYNTDMYNIYIYIYIYIYMSIYIIYLPMCNNISYIDACIYIIKVNFFSFK